jgi:hypothetical protein
VNTLVELVLGRLLAFAAHVDDQRFEVQREAMLRGYANEDIKPSRYARNLRLQVADALPLMTTPSWRCMDAKPLSSRLFQRGNRAQPLRA